MMTWSLITPATVAAYHLPLDSTQPLSLLMHMLKKKEHLVACMYGAQELDVKHHTHAEAIVYDSLYGITYYHWACGGWQSLGFTRT